jgi:S1-C subfamily serine protease
LAACKQTQLRTIAPTQPRTAAAPYQWAIDGTVTVTRDGELAGTGFVVKQDGRYYMWTAAHVVSCWCEQEHSYALSKRLEIEGIHVGEQSYTIEPVKVDPLFDIALFRIEKRYGGPGLKFAGRARVPVGTPVYSVGNPSGLESTLSFGYVSKLERDTKIYLWPLDQLQITTIGGTSGSPVFNYQGEVVGMIVAGRVEYRGIGYMIPVRKLRAWSVLTPDALDMFPQTE